MIFDVSNFIELINKELNRNDIKLKQLDDKTYEIRERFPFIKDIYFTRKVGYIRITEKEDNKKLRLELHKPLYKIENGEMYYKMPRMRLKIIKDNNSIKEEIYERLFPQGDFPLSKYIAIGIKDPNLENKINAEWFIKN